MMTALPFALSTALTLAGAAGAQDPPAPPAAAATPLICGFHLGSAALAELADYGGTDGRLGCATADEAVTAPTRAGVRSLIAPFGDRGAIVTILSGPLSGRAFVVPGCAWRLYFQMGGAGGLLGLPQGDPRNTPDGQVQPFDGASVRATRAFSSCEIVFPGDE
jgi:hypothetical protein